MQMQRATPLSRARGVVVRGRASAASRTTGLTLGFGHGGIPRFSHDTYIEGGANSTDAPLPTALKTKRPSAAKPGCFWPIFVQLLVFLLCKNMQTRPTNSNSNFPDANVLIDMGVVKHDFKNADGNELPQNLYTVPTTAHTTYLMRRCGGCVRQQQRNRKTATTKRAFICTSAWGVGLFFNDQAVFFKHQVLGDTAQKQQRGIAGGRSVPVVEISQGKGAP